MLRPREPRGDRDRHRPVGADRRPEQEPRQQHDDEVRRDRDDEVRHGRGERTAGRNARKLIEEEKVDIIMGTAGVPAAALPNVAGPGKLVFDYGDSAAYLIEAATAADLEAVAAKLEVLGGRLALVLKKLPE